MHVRTAFEHSPQQVLHGRRQQVVGHHVLLFVHRLELALEHPEHGIYHSLAAQFGPLAHKLGGERIVINSEIVRRGGVEPRPSEVRYQVVELVWYHVFGRLVAQPVDVGLQTAPHAGVGGFGQQVVLGRYGVEPLFLGLIIRGAYLVGTLKHKVLEIVGYARIGTLVGSGLDHHGSQHLWLRMVFAQPYGHAVGQFKLPYTCVACPKSLQTTGGQGYCYRKQ